MEPIFNYIITIHNKEELIEKVINSIIKCSHKNSFIYPVLDGCTDKSEEIIDEIILNNPHVQISKIIMNDVHEILSINAGLSISNQKVEGYNIILQDDVILKDYNLENKVDQLYKRIGVKLGYTSFRLGANLKQDFISNDESSLFVNFVESAYGHAISNTDVLLPGQFAFRNIAIKSPVCIPTSIINKFGLLDEKLAPCFHDDTEYSLRLIRNGYKNGVFVLDYESDLDWGGTREKPNPRYAEYIKNNIAYIRKEYQEDIVKIISSKQDLEVLTFADFCDENESKKALETYNLNYKKREQYEIKELTLFGRIKYFLSKGIFYRPLRFIFNLLKTK